MPWRPKSHGQLKRERGLVPEMPRPTSTERGYDGNWQKVRAMKLRREPLCEACKAKGRIKPAKDVHHLIAGSNNLDDLQSLCHVCHSRVTMRELNKNRRL